MRHIISEIEVFFECELDSWGGCNLLCHVTAINGQSPVEACGGYCGVALTGDDPEAYHLALSEAIEAAAKGYATT